MQCVQAVANVALAVFAHSKLLEVSKFPELMLEQKFVYDVLESPLLVEPLSATGISSIGMPSFPVCFVKGAFGLILRLAKVSAHAHCSPSHCPLCSRSLLPIIRPYVASAAAGRRGAVASSGHVADNNGQMAHQASVTPATTTQAIGAVRKGLPTGKLTQMAQLLAVDRALLLQIDRKSTRL